MTRYKDAHLEAAFKGEQYLIIDGAMGTMLQGVGLSVGELPDLWCLKEPQKVSAVHRAYVEAGSEVITTNTFGTNALSFDGDEAKVDEIFTAAVTCARDAKARYIAGDIGPTGEFLEPLGELSEQKAKELFASQARAAVNAGVDLFIIETMTDLNEMQAAVEAVQSVCDLPIIATMSFGQSGRTFMGVDPVSCAEKLTELKVNAVGINCSLGPVEIEPLAKQMLEVTDLPVAVQANAGLPQVTDGQTTYPVGPDEYAAALVPMLDAGVSIIGSCCGSTPEYIAREVQLVADRVPAKRKKRI